MKRAIFKILKFVILISVFVGFVFLLRYYYYNDGFYVIDKTFMSEIDFINKYSMLDFPENTYIEKFIIEKDYHSFFFSHNEVLSTKLVVPEEVIDEVFPEKSRMYEKKYILPLVDESIVDNIEFGKRIPTRVDKWYWCTSRYVTINVMKPVNGCYDVYICVDKLGYR